MLDMERLDRIDAHLREIKKNEDERTMILLSIQTSLIGSNMNGHKGIVSTVEYLEKRVRSLENQEAETQVYLKQIRVLLVLFFGALITIILNLFLVQAK